MGFFGFVLASGNPAPVLQLVEQTLDQVAPAVFLSVVRDWVAAVALRGDQRFDAGSGDLLADGIGIIAAIGQDAAIRSPIMRNNGAKPCTSCA